LLVDLAPTLKLYVEYVNKFDDAMVAYGDLSKNNQKFAEFLATAKTNAAINLDLASILIMPVQRIPRYELLLRELIKCTTEMHVDWNNLQKAQKVCLLSLLFFLFTPRKFRLLIYTSTHRN
jgi:hypothetical protein